MKVVLEGKDARNVGVKDMSQMAMPLNMNVQELCDPKAKPTMSSIKLATTPLSASSTASSPQTYTTLSPQSHSCSNSPQDSSSSPVTVSPEVSSIPPNVVSNIPPVFKKKQGIILNCS